MARFKSLVERKSLLENEIKRMTEVEKLEFEFDWICAEMERLEKEGREIGLKLANLRGEQCSVCSVPLIQKDEKERGICTACYCPF
jgi:predicted nuclease with TOPRIM domain